MVQGLRPPVVDIASPIDRGTFEWKVEAVIGDKALKLLCDLLRGGEGRESRACPCLQDDARSSGGWLQVQLRVLPDAQTTAYLKCVCE